METSPLVSIIVINFNGKKYLKDCFNSLLQGSYKNIEIIFVDNGSSDGSLEFVSNNYKNIRIIDNKFNLGLAVASNRGAGVANGKHLFFYNNDTIADKELIADLVEAMKQDPEIGIAGCRTYTYDGKNLINAGVACDIFSYPYAKAKPFYVDAAIFTRKDIFYKIGGFDEKMFLYGEDKDICWRCWLYGYKVTVIDKARFFHDSACITKDIRQYHTSITKRFWGEFNSLRSILKNYSLFFLFFILPLYIAINIVEVCVFSLKGEFGVIKNAYLKSYIENIRNIKDILRWRSKIQKERKISDFDLIKHMSKASGKLSLFLSMGIPRFNEQITYGK